MRNRLFGSAMAMAALVVIVSLVPIPASGQALTAAEAWTPPRTPDGQPDIQGFWNDQAAMPSYDIESGGGDLRHYTITGMKHDYLRVIMEPADGKVPYQPWAAAKRKAILDNHLNPKLEHLDPVARCYLTGVPRSVYHSYGLQILQTPGYVLMRSEFVQAFRLIPLDGRPHPGDGIQLWMGDSRGRWEGNTLIVDVTNFTDKTWLDTVGAFHSDALHVVERWTVIDADTMHYEATIEDPKVYTQPWKIAFPMARNKQKDYEGMEFACREGNRAPENMLGR